MTTHTPVEPGAFTERLPEIEAELRRIITARIGGNPQPTVDALRQAFTNLFGHTGSSRELRQFFLFVARLMRHLTIELGRTGHASGTVNLNAMELDQWLVRLEGFDPECTRMIDLHYFIGLSTRETAAMLGLSPQAVIRDLRFAKAWLQARVRWAGGATGKS